MTANRQVNAMSTHSLASNVVPGNNNNVEMRMSTTFRMAAPEKGRARSRGSALVATVKKWWIAYLTRRIERVAIVQLEAMSGRELEDIGLDRSQIEPAVRGERRRRARTS